MKIDDNLLLLKCDMGAGHFSKSGRFVFFGRSVTTLRLFLLSLPDLLNLVLYFPFYPAAASRLEFVPSSVLLSL
jgi:hypothetical protein